MRAKIEEAISLFHRVQESQSSTVAEFVTNVQGSEISDYGEFPDIIFSEEVLTKASLRGYKAPVEETPADITILVHKCEGRVFLTDRNGFYNDFLQEEWV